MTSAVETFKDFPSLCEVHSDVSTEGEEEIAYFNKNGCFSKSIKCKRTQKTKIKSSLCKNYVQTGSCPYGSKCQFAHGTHELRCNAQVNVAYKTKYCNSFLNKKWCVYGFRCNFIHESNTPAKNEEKWREIYANHRETIAGNKGREKSRLLQILKK